MYFRGLACLEFAFWGVSCWCINLKDSSGFSSHEILHLLCFFSSAYFWALKEICFPNIFASLGNL